jgi:hypothetical protein
LKSVNPLACRSWDLPLLGRSGKQVISPIASACLADRLDQLRPRWLPRAFSRSPHQRYDPIRGLGFECQPPLTEALTLSHGMSG